jgi:hypothetical protein
VQSFAATTTGTIAAGAELRLDAHVETHPGSRRHQGGEQDQAETTQLPMFRAHLFLSSPSKACRSEVPSE